MDEFTCQWCGLQKQACELVPDHVVPVIKGGKHEIGNVVTACVSCNSRKWSQDPLTFAVGKTPLNRLSKILDTISTGLHSPKEKEKVKAKEKDKDIESDFDAFWTLYPKKVAKSDAEKAFTKVMARQIAYQTVVEGLNRAKASLAWCKDNGQFIPHAATWLNGERFNDLYDVKQNGFTIASKPPAPHKGVEQSAAEYKKFGAKIAEFGKSL